MVRTRETEALIEASPEDVGMSSERLGRLSRLVQGYVDSGKIPGAITALVRQDKLVHFETYGRMDDEAGKEMRADAIFRIYSMTKPIVSVGLMTLYEEGRFHLDEPASKYIPAFEDLKVYVGGSPDNYEVREPSREMTIADLLRHTSGLIYGMPNWPTPLGEIYARAGLAGLRADAPLAEMAQRLGKLPLQCDPGSRWIYSVSTDVVGYLCEVLSGQTLDVFLQERIFKPLGMVDTAFHVPGDKVERFAACYRRGGEGEPPYLLQDPPGGSAYLKPPVFLSGGGGLVSTAADFLRFARMLARGGELDGVRILGPRTLSFMTRNHLPGGADIASMVMGTVGASLHGTGFGLGFAVVLDPAKAQTLSSPGEYYWSGAASTEFFVAPQEDMVVLFLTQLLQANYSFRRDLRVATYQAIIS